MKKNNILIYVLLLITLENKSQSRWVKQYIEGLNTPGHNISISYDYGYLITGRIIPDYEYTWLIKTDVNGEILWDKIIKGYYDRIIIDDFKQNEEGDIFLCGGIVQEGNTDPLLMKLNSCGEKEWCRSSSTTSNNDFYMDVVDTPDGGCAALVFGAFLPLYNFRAGILRFSQEGDLLWQQYYQSSNQGVNNEELSNLLLTPDQGFLMTGDCGYPDPDNPTISWLHPYYVKVDSLGNFEWEVILHMETGDLGGEAWQTILNPTGNCYYSCISHYYHLDNLYTRRPAIVKINLQGIIIDVYDLINGEYDWGALHSASFINDSLLAGGVGWGYFNETEQSRAVIFDTLGYIRDSVTLLNTSWLSKTAITHDGKLLFYNTIEEDDGFDTYLFKLTQNLDQDTFYTSAFIYDSLCPHQIASDTIVPDDCGVIVGIEETVGGEAGKWGSMEIWPNPASSLIHGRLSMDSLSASWRNGRFSRDLTFVIYDIFGRKVQEIKVPDRQREFQINVEGYPPGEYIAILKNGFDLVESRKFVVAH